MATIILGAQSNVWTQLTLPNPPAGSVPFVWTDGTTIAADPLNFNYDSVNSILNVTNGIAVNIIGALNPPLPGGGTQVVANGVAGRAILLAGVTNLTVNSSSYKTGDIVIAQLETVDATAVSLIVYGTGLPNQFFIQPKIPPTSNTTISWFIVKQSPTN